MLSEVLYAQAGGNAAHGGDPDHEHLYQGTLSLMEDAYTATLDYNMDVSPSALTIGLTQGYTIKSNIGNFFTDDN